MPKFTVVDLSNVLVDGVSAGSITDVFANHGRTSGDQGELLSSLHSWHQAILDNHANEMKSRGDQYTAAAANQVASHEADLVKLQSQHQVKLDALLDQQQAEQDNHRKIVKAWEAQQDALRQNLVTAHAKQITELQAKLKRVHENLKEYQTHMKTLGDLPVIRKLARETRRKSIRHELDQLEKEEAVEANPAEPQPS